MATSDINFVHALHAQASAQPDKKVNLIFLLIIAFFVMVVVWAALSSIDELARGEGKIIPSEKIQSIQSLDGGVVAEILIHEGSKVIKGQPLMKIDTTRFKATREENQQVYLGLKIKKIRLEKQYDTNPQKKLPKLVFPKELEKSASHFVLSESNIFNAQLNEVKINLSILESQYKQKVQELKEQRNKRNRLEKTRKLSSNELNTIKKLAKSGAKSRIDLITVQKEYNSIEGDLEASKLAIPRLQLAISEAKNKVIEKVQNFRSQIAQELQEANIELKKYESKLVGDTDKLEKTIIKSPVNGIIKQLNVNTVGGVVKSGEVLVEIVPHSDILLVEAKLDPKDIAFINPSQKVIIKITAYDFSIYGALEGKIEEISADSIKDEDSKDGKTYYKVIIKTDKNYLEHNGKKFYMLPGMIASVDIVTGKKTILDFLLKPILKTKQNALHER